MNERIREPRQDRSQATMERVLDAFEKLLRKSSYETITINDIAAESSTGAGSIYARKFTHSPRDELLTRAAH